MKCYRCGTWNGAGCDCKDGQTVIHGDCREYLPLLPNVDLVLTDPPYEIEGRGGGIGAKRQYLADIVGFTDCGFDTALLAGFDNWIVFCGKPQLTGIIAAAADRRWMLVTWNKPDPTPLCGGNYLPDTEYIIHAFRSGRLFGEYADKARFIVHPVPRDRFGHPNVKPIAVIEKMLRLGSEFGNTVVDLFLGSGTTLRACKDLGRRGIGIELEEKYCEIAAKRLEQGVLFAPTPTIEQPKQSSFLA